MARVAIGGFLHETNTFAPTKADYDAFMHGGGRASIDDAASVLTTM
ncbi:MAG: M81 family metallopeptidase, partial [Bradyrhizobium sp.]|nr:M81 family metallopeptidase [Bradyrhizobium sp.]